MATNYQKVLEQIGQRIEQLRKERGMTQEALADKAGISHAYYWSIVKNGRNLSIKTALSIANALKVSLSELFDY